MNNLFMVVDAVSRGNFDRLSRHRIPGALPFGAKYRLIDFTLSNCKNSEIRNVAIFPYGNYRSLADHIGSGDRWDLNRRKDGIFLLPPKNLNMTAEASVSFQRMYEQLEYFRRSNQEYVIVTPCTIVWNIDYNVILHHHLVAKADITEVLAANGRRLKTFLLSKKRLLEYVVDYDTIPFRNLIDVFDHAENLVKDRFVFKPISFFIENTADLYQADMALLREDVKAAIFHPARPIYSKETMSSPTRYGVQADVKQSLVASGAVIEGTVLRSVIGRKAVIRKGARVVDSVLMNQCIVEEGAQIRHAILDKESRVLKNAVVNGSPEDLFVTEKKQIVANDEDLTVVQMAVECQPFVKTGGLADVVGALAEHYARLGVESRVILPLYPSVKQKYQYLLEMRADGVIDFNQKKYKVTFYTYSNENVLYGFVESYDFFDRPQIYGYADDGDRFAFFSKACLTFLELLPDIPEIVHLHDWHCGLIPTMMKEEPRLAEVRTVLTIHNLEYQGVFDAGLLSRAGIRTIVPGGPQINFMEIGLNAATKITTVSPTYREELKYEYYAKNFVNLLIRRDHDFYGILNGLGEEFDPRKDVAIAKKYDRESVETAKPKNKEDLQKRMGLWVGEDFFVMGMVTRIVEQKGFDILFYAMEQLLVDPRVQFVLLGVGEDRYVEGLRQMEARYPGRVKMNIGYDATLPNYIYAGADAFLMPSRYEPCGTGQMIAMRYGTIPIVRQTGGLNDTVQSYDPSTGQGNGFKFYNFDSRDFAFQMENALRLFRQDRRAWNRLIDNAMAGQFSFETSAKEYVELFRSML
ncbi:MAG TPA: glycogen/starch synthase [Candidatus Izemoplasmatales bacterium]|nr:glycogen/starch synthase [Candidatus Izemoplasmatales bacterium]